MRWNDHVTVRLVQFEYEHDSTARPIRLASAAARAGDPVKVTMGGVEVEGIITEIAIHVIHIRIGGKLF